MRNEMLNLSLPFCVALYKILTSLGSFMSFARWNSGFVCLLFFLSLVVIAVVNLLTQTCSEHDTQKPATTFRGNTFSFLQTGKLRHRKPSELKFSLPVSANEVKSVLLTLVVQEMRKT